MQHELVERAQRGDAGAFETLVHGVADGLYAIAWRILRDPDRAEDALQQALIRMWEKLSSLRDPERFDAWAYRLVVHASYREARRQPRWTPRVREISIDPPDDDPVGAIIDRDELERGFRHLSAEHRAVLVLHYFAGLPVSEVAETLGIPVGTAGSRLHYAVRSLRAAYEADARGIVAWRTPA
ncbi:MAG: sigma-70 family RNA polymerase sigma factor [Candidatus Limnocylindrales bacterium]|nr:sigma-70 family RNA polymerase sigma factor [Candidatus Limnocylindrales bacterium]